MNEPQLTTDEYHALDHIRRGARHDRVNACIGRNAKRLASLKLIEHGRDGAVALTAKGQQQLLVRRCIDGLQALLEDPSAPLEADVVQFLGRKSHIAARAEGGFAVTARGKESLADIAAMQAQRR